MTAIAAERPVSAATAGERLFGFVARSHARACTVLLLLSLACFLPGFVSLQPMDRDEPRFAQATKQMLETGDFVDIRFQEAARHKKPVGIHWLQSASVLTAEALGLPQARTTIAVYRVPSLLGAVAMVLLTYWAALAFAGRREAFLAAAFVAASVILIVEARLAKTDAVLGACTVAAMGALARAYLARGVPQPAATVAIFWTAVGLGILVKGPMVLMFAGLPALVLSIRERSARWLLALRPGIGLLVVAAFAAPWFVAIAAKTGGAFFASAVGGDLLGKVATGQENHWGPPGFYFVAFFATFWPAAPLAAIAAPFLWRHRREDAMAFALAWIVPSWLVFEAVSTKLPHYVMPLYPMIAIVTALALARGAVGPHRPGAKATALLVVVVPFAVVAALAFGAWTLEGSVPAAGLAVAAAAALVSVQAWRLFVRDEAVPAALAGIGASVLLVLGCLGLAQPTLEALRISPRLAAVARAFDCPGASIGSAGYVEPSLVFLAGTQVRLMPNGATAAAFAAQGGCRLIFVEGRHEPDFRATLAALGIAAEPVARVSGFNINGGRRVDIGAWAVGGSLRRGG